ncbi:MAG: F0F1 ATP synthase subunit B [Actinomycetota bacterium]|jgi:F-type H+-transporting ATPase subunit b|nr:F0F1 ATP synthase subunit B [Euzebyaceae bacterium]MDQ3453492.1 F0F1 ATP synthase subunit B [Actinomycetota bacterium]
MQVVATIFVLATEAGEEASGLDLVLPDTAELIWGLVGFALLMVVMVRKVFPALYKMLDERSAKIQGQIEEAESQRQEAEQLRRQHAEQLADARSEANAIVEQARSDAERVRADVTSRAEEEANQIRSRARQDADSERGRVIQDLRGQVATLSVDLASQIVRRELDPERHRALVDQYINELSGMN